MRAVLDTNVLVSGLLSPLGASARLLTRWSSGDFELVVSDLLLAELGDTLARPKLRKHVSEGHAAEFVSVLAHVATVLPDPDDIAQRCEDPDDDFLVALAESARAYLVSGDRHLLALRDAFPVRTPREFLAELGG